MIALWQPSPWFINAILWILPMFYASAKPEDVEGEEDGQDSEDYHADLEYLGNIYSVAFVMSAVAHVATMSICVFSKRSEHSFSQIFIPGEITPDTSLSEALRMIFQVDYWIIFSAALVVAYFAVWDLKRIGMTDVRILNMAVTIVIRSILLGPAATTVGIWYWREYTMINKPTTTTKDKHR